MNIGDLISNPIALMWGAIAVVVVICLFVLRRDILGFIESSFRPRLNGIGTVIEKYISPHDGMTQEQYCIAVRLKEKSAWIWVDYQSYNRYSLGDSIVVGYVLGRFTDRMYLKTYTAK